MTQSSILRLTEAAAARRWFVRPFILALVLIGAPTSAQVARHEPRLPGVVDPTARLAADLLSGRVLLRGVAFDAGGATISPSSTGALQQLVAALRLTTGTYLIESHTAPGPDSQALSDRRAAAVRTWLLAAGVEPWRLYAAGFGGTRPRSPPKNRRDQPLTDRIEISRVS